MHSANHFDSISLFACAMMCQKCDRDELRATFGSRKYAARENDSRIVATIGISTEDDSKKPMLRCTELGGTPHSHGPYANQLDTSADSIHLNLEFRRQRCPNTEATKQPLFINHSQPSPPTQAACQRLLGKAPSKDPRLYFLTEAG